MKKLRNVLGLAHKAEERRCWEVKALLTNRRKPIKSNNQPNRSGMQNSLASMFVKKRMDRFIGKRR